VAAGGGRWQWEFSETELQVDLLLHILKDGTRRCISELITKCIYNCTALPPVSVSIQRNM